jgi:hypothetical protein
MNGSIAYDGRLSEAGEHGSYVVSCHMDGNSLRRLVSLNNKCLNVVLLRVKNSRCDPLIRLESTLEEPRVLSLRASTSSYR